jgi:hypothetical protein
MTEVFENDVAGKPCRRDSGLEELAKKIIGHGIHDITFPFFCLMFDSPRVFIRKSVVKLLMFYTKRMVVQNCRENPCQSS